MFNIGYIQLSAIQYNPNIAIRELRDALRGGYDINTIYDGKTLLMHAVDWEVPHEVSHFILRNGADVSIQNIVGDTALLCAIRQNNFHEAENGYIICRTLLDWGSNVNAFNELGTTPLMIACSRGYFEHARLFISRGAKVNFFDNAMDTALHRTCTGFFLAFGDEEKADNLIRCMQLLLDNGARINERNARHNTALDVLIETDHLGNTLNYKAVKFLVRHGAEYNRSVKKYYYDEIKEFQVLAQEIINLERAIDPNIENKRQIEALVIAALNVSQKLMKDLNLHGYPRNVGLYDFRAQLAYLKTVLN